MQQDKLSLGIKLYDRASATDIALFESTMGIRLPADIRYFYQSFNGFESNEDMFRIIPLDEIMENNGQDINLKGEKDFHIAEYMIYSDMWTVAINEKIAVIPSTIKRMILSS